MSDAYLHEAWCPRCHVSHPPGTRRCLHCGGDVLPARPGERLRGASPPAARGPIEIAAPGDGAADAEADEGNARVARPMRMGIAALWMVLAIAGAIVRACTERG